MLTHSSFWLLVVPAFITGGLFLKIVELLIAWAKERREQQSRKTAHQKDRPRFRIDISIVPHTSASSAVVKILSLGSLPLTIKHGEIFIEAPTIRRRVYPSRKTLTGQPQPSKFLHFIPSDAESDLTAILQYFGTKSGFHPRCGDPKACWTRLSRCLAFT